MVTTLAAPGTAIGSVSPVVAAVDGEAHVFIAASSAVLSLTTGMLCPTDRFPALYTCSGNGNCDCHTGCVRYKCVLLQQHARGQHLTCRSRLPWPQASAPVMALATQAMLVKL